MIRKHSSDFFRPVAGEYVLRDGRTMPITPLDGIGYEIMQTEWDDKPEAERRVTTLLDVARRVTAEEYHEAVGRMQVKELYTVCAIASGLIAAVEGEHDPNGESPAGKGPPG